MLKIRMQRTGRINSPSYRVVVVEHTESPKTGNIVEKVGTYNPKTKERVLDAERIKYWMSVGAKPSATVHNMLVSLGILNAKKINVLPKYKEPVPAEGGSASGGKAETEAAAAPTSEEVGVPTSDESQSVVKAPAETPAEPAPEAEVVAPTEPSAAPDSAKASTKASTSEEAVAGKQA